MKLIWFQRDDGRWNADCTCESSLCGILFEERAQFEELHIANVQRDRDRGVERAPCGPKFPDYNPYNPSPMVFP